MEIVKRDFGGCKMKNFVAYQLEGENLILGMCLFMSYKVSYKESPLEYRGL